MSGCSLTPVVRTLASTQDATSIDTGTRGSLQVPYKTRGSRALPDPSPLGRPRDREEELKTPPSVTRWRLSTHVTRDPSETSLFPLPRSVRLTPPTRWRGLTRGVWRILPEVPRKTLTVVRVSLCPWPKGMFWNRSRHPFLGFPKSTGDGGRPLYLGISRRSVGGDGVGEFRSKGLVR